MNYRWQALLLCIVSEQSVADIVCNDSFVNYYPVYEPKSIVCNNGYFLPANSEECVLCPSENNCVGGTFEFNPNKITGLDLESITETQINRACAVNFPKNLYAEYEPNKHTCPSGYYLPANIDECTLRPSGNKCVGGTYYFNETVNQGIVACVDDTFAPNGSAVCYPHIMHIGDDVIYLRSYKTTTPSLNIKIGSDIFYANMTPIRTKMNKDSEHYFRAQWKNNDYYICDDTVYEE